MRGPGDVAAPEAQQEPVLKEEERSTQTWRRTTMQSNQHVPRRFWERDEVAVVRRVEATPFSALNSRQSRVLGLRQVSAEGPGWPLACFQGVYREELLS